MRATGRTSRIVDFVVDQLFQHGQCVSTDHITYENDRISMTELIPFVTKVIERIKHSTQEKNKAIYNIQKVNDIYVVHFKMVKNENDAV
jgi:hypothetical protein